MRPRLYIVKIQAVAVAQNLTNSGQRNGFFMAKIELCHHISCKSNIKDELSPNPSLIRPGIQSEAVQYITKNIKRNFF